MNGQPSWSLQHGKGRHTEWIHSEGTRAVSDEVWDALGHQQRVCNTPICYLYPGLRGVTDCTGAAHEGQWEHGVNESAIGEP